MNSDHEDLPDVLAHDGAADGGNENDGVGQDIPAVVREGAIVPIESDSDGERDGMGLAAVVEDKRSQNKLLKQKANDIKKSFVSLLMRKNNMHLQAYLKPHLIKKVFEKAGLPVSLEVCKKVFRMSPTAKSRSPTINMLVVMLRIVKKSDLNEYAKFGGQFENVLAILHPTTYMNLPDDCALISAANEQNEEAEQVTDPVSVPAATLYDFANTKKKENRIATAALVAFEMGNTAVMREMGTEERVRALTRISQRAPYLANDTDFNSPENSNKAFRDAIRFIEDRMPIELSE